MPRTRNVTRQQWDAAVSADPNASAVRSAASTSSHHNRTTSRSSMTHARAEERRERASSLSVGSSKENHFGHDDADEENDENARENNTPPLMGGKGKGKEVARGERTGRLGRKRPLQDITDTVVTRPNLPSDSDDIPRRRRRRVRQILDATPVSPLSPSPTKRREPPARHIRFPSSLPPSSPPPPLSLSLEHTTLDKRNPIWENIIPEDQEDLPSASDNDNRRPSSDPFGFFTVERELKAKRTHEAAGPSTQAREAGGLILVAATSPLTLDLGAVLDADDEEEEVISPCATPPTPHKRKRKRAHEEEKEVLLFSPTTESLPSSPSPLKVREPWVKERTIQNNSDFIRSSTGHSDNAREPLAEREEGNGEEDQDDGNETVTEITHRVLRSSMKGKGKQKEEATSVSKRKIRRKAHDEDGNKTPSDPAEFAQMLVNRLPKRRKKVKEEAVNKGSKSREKLKTKHMRKPGSKKPKSKAPVAAKPDKERLAIRDYFKQLDKYSLEEEKVYTTATNAMDFDTITEVFDPKLSHAILPSSLQRPVLKYEQYFRYLDDITEMFLEFRVKISDIIEEGPKMTVQMVVSGRGRSQRNYVNEAVLIISFERVSSRDIRKYGSNGSLWPPEALPKMVDVKEFVDSLSTKTFFTEERQWMKENGAIVAEQRSRQEGEWRKDRWRRRQQNLQPIRTAPMVHPGRPTSIAQGSSTSPTSIYPSGGTSGYQYGYGSAFPAGGGFTPPSRSHGQSSSSRGYQPSTSLGTAGQSQSYSLQYARPSSGYPGSYHPQSKDRHGGN